VAVASVVSDALFLLSQSTRAHDVRVEHRIEPPELAAQCDANGLEQVMLNLLSNAVDATAEVVAPRVLVHARKDGCWVCIEVHDNGGGISEEVAPRLFEPFFSTKEQGVGLGLGLAISAGIVRDFGGTLRACASEALGGAVFVVQLKAAEPQTGHA
jgi:two-component system C4-dicarboxylate transport sensor histidine kinase DctB